jgi:hypothetical protein
MRDTHTNDPARHNKGRGQNGFQALLQKDLAWNSIHSIGDESGVAAIDVHGNGAAS